MAEPIEITREDHTTHGAYKAAIEGADRPAEMTWQASGKARVVDHTFTPPEARGKGIAMQLVEAIVADARSDGFTIVPQCPYVDAAFRRNPDWADVRAEIES